MSFVVKPDGVCSRGFVILSLSGAPVGAGPLRPRKPLLEERAFSSRGLCWKSRPLRPRKPLVEERVPLRPRKPLVEERAFTPRVSFGGRAGL